MTQPNQPCQLCGCTDRTLYDMEGYGMICVECCDTVKYDYSEEAQEWTERCIENRIRFKEIGESYI